MLAAMVLAALVLLAGTSDRTGRVGALLLAAVSVGWLLTNKAVEGPVLLRLGDDRGVTGADLASLAGFAVVGWRLMRPSRRQPSGTPTGTPG